MEALIDAVEADRFAWEPHREATTGITYDHCRDSKSGTWKLRGRKEGEVLWEVALEGEPVEGDLSWGVYAREDAPDLVHADPDSGRIFLSVVTRKSMVAGNEYSVPPGKYKLSNWYALETGHRAVVEVLGPQAPRVEWLVRAYDRETGQRIWERETRYLESGGRAAGARTENWLRQIVRTFDPKTGTTTSEEKFRVEGSTAVKVEKGD